MSAKPRTTADDLAAFKKVRAKSGPARADYMNPGDPGSAAQRQADEFDALQSEVWDVQQGSRGIADADGEDARKTGQKARERRTPESLRDGEGEDEAPSLEDEFDLSDVFDDQGNLVGEGAGGDTGQDGGQEGGSSWLDQLNDGEYDSFLTVLELDNVPPEILDRLDSFPEQTVREWHAAAKGRQAKVDREISIARSGGRADSAEDGRGESEGESVGAGQPSPITVKALLGDDADYLEEGVVSKLNRKLRETINPLRDELAAERQLRQAAEGARAMAPVVAEVRQELGERIPALRDRSTWRRLDRRIGQLLSSGAYDHLGSGRDAYREAAEDAAVREFGRDVYAAAAAGNDGTTPSRGRAGRRKRQRKAGPLSVGTRSKVKPKETRSRAQRDAAVYAHLRKRPGDTDGARRAGGYG